MRRSRILAIAATSLVLALAACSADDDKASTADAPAAMAVTAAATSAAASSAPATDAYGDGQNVQPGPAAESGKAASGETVIRGRVATGREDIIKIAKLTLEAASVDRARDEAADQADAHGAQISSESQAGTGKNKSATMVFRVLPGDFDNFVTALGRLTDVEVVGRDISSDDVTGQVADIEGRIRAAKDSAEKIRALIQRAEKITDLVTLEREYQARDAEIQSMSSQLASLKDRAGRSTVTLSIGPAKEKPKEVVPPEKREAGFMGGLKAGWDAFTATTVVAATALGALLPFLVLTGVVLIVWWAIRRRRPAAAKPVDTDPLPTPAT